MAYMLQLTIPVTVAVCERSFSELKLIENYLWSTMSQERVSDLAVLSFENKHASELDVANTVETFAQKSERFKP